jgi:hypothetical protein
VVKKSRISKNILYASNSMRSESLKYQVSLGRRSPRPNPSIERTSTGLARFTSLVYVSLRGPSQWRPAHVKR